MKKVFVALLAVVLAFGLAGCGEKKTYEIGLVTDVGTINDKSFNQGAWEGVEAYAEEFGISYKYYQPDSKTTEDYVKSIEIAVENGAKVIVTPGYLFENAIWLTQDKFPFVKFILLDGSPNNVTDWGNETTPPTTIENGDMNFDIGANVYSVFYAEEESGFLAGYAAVKDGFTKLGFMGGMSVPAVVRFGLGFVQGANYAAAEMGLDDNAIEINYEYLNSFAPDNAHQTKAASWYSAGTEVIFVAAGGAGNSVMKAAEQSTNKYVIGVDVDQSAESETVITSAKKELAISVYNILTEIYGNRVLVDGDAIVQSNGRSINLDASVDGVGLPSDFSRFRTFTKAMYDSVFAKVSAKEVVIVKDTAVAADDLNTPKVNVIVK